MPYDATTKPVTPDPKSPDYIRQLVAWAEANRPANVVACSYPSPRAIRGSGGSEVVWGQA
jgi:hypothetical protein